MAEHTGQPGIPPPPPVLASIPAVHAEVCLQLTVPSALSLRVNHGPCQSRYQALFVSPSSASARFLGRNMTSFFFGASDADSGQRAADTKLRGRERCECERDAREESVWMGD